MRVRSSPAGAAGAAAAWHRRSWNRNCGRTRRRWRGRTGGGRSRVVVECRALRHFFGFERFVQVVIDFDAAPFEGRVGLDEFHRHEARELRAQLVERIERAGGGHSAGAAAELSHRLPATEQQLSQNRHLRLRQVTEPPAHIMPKSLGPPRLGMHDGGQTQFSQLRERVFDVVFGIIRQGVPRAFLVATGRERLERQRIRLGNGERFFDHRPQHAALRRSERRNGRGVAYQRCDIIVHKRLSMRCLKNRGDF